MKNAAHLADQMCYLCPEPRVLPMVRSSPETNLVLLARRALSARRLVLVFGCGFSSELKRAGGRAACPLARAPLRLNLVGLPRRGLGGGRAAKVIHNDAFVGKPYALVGPINDFCDWGIGRRGFFN